MSAAATVFVLPSFAGGGAERVTLALMSALDRRRFAPALIVLSGEGPLAGRVPDGVPVHDLATPRLRRALPALIARLRRLQPQTVVSSFGYVNLALLALRPALPRGVRVIVREANMPSLSLPNAPYPRLLRLGYRYFYRRADTVICSSEAMRAELARDFGVPEARLAVLANPVDREALRAAATPPRRAPGPGVRFVAAGRLHRQKGFDRLIAMMAEMPADAHLTIFGAGPEDAALTRQAESLGLAARVRFAGFAPAPWADFAGADAFLLPSRWEGMPNAALEAFACGTPVIATPDSGGLPALAGDCPSGALRIATIPEDFLAEMQRVRAAAPVEPRRDLLPEAFALSRVAARFAALLAGET